MTRALAALALALITASTLGFGCSLDNHPSLGWDELLIKPAEGGAGPEPSAGGNGAAGEMAMVGMDAGMEPAPDAGPSLVDAGPPAAGSGGAPADAGRPSLCDAAEYPIDLDCVFTSGGPNTPWSTTLTVQPMAAQDQSANVIAGIAFKFLEQSFTGDLVGKLNCSTGMLQMQVENGMCLLVGGGPPLPFDGVLEGTIDAHGQAGGTWWYGMDGVAMCTGAWMGALKH